VNRFR